MSASTSTRDIAPCLQFALAVIRQWRRYPRTMRLHRLVAVILSSPSRRAPEYERCGVKLPFPTQFLRPFVGQEPTSGPTTQQSPSRSTPRTRTSDPGAQSMFFRMLDRAHPRAGLLHTGGRSPARASGGDDLPRAAAQRRHPKRRPRVSRDNSAMARRARCSPPKAAKLARNAALRTWSGNDWLASSWLRAVLLFPARSCPGKAVGTDHGRTKAGQTPGARSS
jgi:hypothetical protein